MFICIANRGPGELGWAATVDQPCPFRVANPHRTQIDLGEATAAPDQTILARWVAGGLRSVLYAEVNPIRVFIFSA